MSIQVKHIDKRFGNFVALDNVSLDFGEGQLTALLGPSGCGKTTLLRIIAGLERADAGQILLEGRDASHQHVRQRQVGFVFQHYALFRHMSVFENVAFGLRVKPRGERPSEQQIRDKVRSLLELVQLDWLADRYPAQLSGGQRQRIALARALAVEPRVLLLDEPFGALDAKVRKELRRWLRRLHDELHVTSIFVTHDQEEALEVADQVVLMHRGRVEQVGSPEAVYEHPATPFVFGFLGNVNRFHGRLEPGQGGGVLHMADGALPVTHGHDAVAGDAVAYVRPHDLDIERYAPGAEGIVVTLRRALTLGPVAQLELEREDSHQLIEVALPLERFRHAAFREGELLAVRPRRLRVFPQAPAGEPAPRAAATVEAAP
ncbi:sulfate/molybdate ABC transporter ATP-binding protein [Cupriavidus respiraculi]|uniref:Sulfate/thiosulfate import ATP-binding protein CysA n=1 Tax=Cupriavidus respiraculi TaxID=195930 RepID=A0ABN7Z9L7_9BURK|nr:sulfate ABC transporter ATP-binding protein [Cupriavidus respiraculi]CAG9180764.1 Sulfate/thiosulfate import ATP-binding protein CysA [Cupriavidus respiraculi]